MYHSLACALAQRGHEVHVICQAVGGCDVNETVNVVIGTPIYRAVAYILDRFLANQKQVPWRFRKVITY